jgi:hypothetical protein
MKKNSIMGADRKILKRGKNYVYQKNIGEWMVAKGANLHFGTWSILSKK